MLVSRFNESQNNKLVFIKQPCDKNYFFHKTQFIEMN